MADASLSPQGNTHGFFARLQPRERRLIFALVIVFFAVVLSVLVFLRGKFVGQLEEEIVDLRTGIELAYTQGAQYQRNAAAKAAREALISSESLLLTTAVEDAAQQVGISARNQQLLPPAELKGGLTKNAVEFDLRGVTLQQLVDFLAKLEATPRHVVMTENLLVRSPSATEDRLNVDVTLATWERSDEDREGE